MAKKHKSDFRLLFTDGAAIKSVNPWDIDDKPEAWTWLSGGPPGVDKTAADYFGKVAWLYRAVTLIAQTCSDLPFSIVNAKTGEEVDKASDYQNAVEFLPNLKNLIWLMIASGELTGRGYAFRTHNRNATKDVRYIIPTSIEPKIDRDKGLTHFKRMVGAQAKDFDLETIIYYYLPDPNVEVGPALNYPAKAALSACGVLFNVDAFVAGFFQRGAVKQTVFSIKGSPPPEERERMETYLASFFSGVKTWFQKVKLFNAEAFTPTIIGEGLESLSDINLTHSQREDIAAAFGIPPSKLFSTEAGGLGGGGVVRQDDLRFYREKIVPTTNALFDVLNIQLLNRHGYQIIANPEALDVFQADESERSTSLLNLVNSGMPLPAALLVLGYEISEEAQVIIDAAEGKTKVLPAEQEVARAAEERAFRKFAKARAKEGKIGEIKGFEFKYVLPEHQLELLAEFTQTDAMHTLNAIRYAFYRGQYAAATS